MQQFLITNYIIDKTLSKYQSFLGFALYHFCINVHSSWHTLYMDRHKCMVHFR